MKQANDAKNNVVYKRVFDTESIELFKRKLYETSWDETEVSQNRDEADKSFLNKFSNLYDAYVSKKQIKLKIRVFQSPWMTNGVKNLPSGNNAFMKSF